MLGFARLAALHDRRDAEVAEDRREALAGDDRDDARAAASRSTAARRPPAPFAVRIGRPRPGRAVNAAARVSRTSRAWLSRFSTLIRLQRARASGRSAMTRSGRSLWTWTLSARGVAGDEHGLADRLEVAADRVDVERSGRSAWSRNIVS